MTTGASLVLPDVNAAESSRNAANNFNELNDKTSETDRASRQVLDQAKQLIAHTAAVQEHVDDFPRYVRTA